MQYRSEIDGLRAIAVVPVLLFHAGFSLFSGGFVGVDVFFVISGYLISSLIYQEAVAGKFSIVNFYERRVRRIIPALIFVIVPCMILAPFVMLPDDYENFAQSIVATLLFGNNILLAITSGYWDLAAEFKPLLHTWSLGVEEQFYILYPIGLIIVLKIRRSLFPFFLIAGLIASFVFNFVLTPPKPESYFYMLHFRAWELLLGAFCGYAERWQQGSKANAINNSLSLLGLLMIVGATITLRGDGGSPALDVVVPCVGTALILSFARSETWVGKLLSTGPFVGIGLISYSTYLWHQPLFAFARILSFEEPSHLLFGGLIIATLLLAWFSWRFVEQPFRDRKRFSRAQIFTYAAIASAALIVPSLMINRNLGYPDRVASMAIGHVPQHEQNMRAFAYMTPGFEDDGKKNLLLLGNSHARDFLYVLLETDQFADYEIVYDNELSLCAGFENQERAHLIAQADAFVTIPGAVFTEDCGLDLDHPALTGKPFVAVGPTHFGYNLNAYMHVPEPDRPLMLARPMPKVIAQNAHHKSYIPATHYLDVQAVFARRLGGLPVFDAQGRITSSDRVHLTPAGVTMFAETLLDDPIWDSFVAR